MMISFGRPKRDKREESSSKLLIGNGIGLFGNPSRRDLVLWFLLAKRSRALILFSDQDYENEYKI